MKVAKMTKKLLMSASLCAAVIATTQHANALTPPLCTAPVDPIVVNFSRAGWYPGPISSTSLSGYSVHIVMNHDARSLKLVSTQKYNGGKDQVRCAFGLGADEFIKLQTLLKGIKTAKSSMMGIDMGDAALSVIDSHGVTTSRLFENSDSAFGKFVIVNGQELQSLLTKYANTKCSIKPIPVSDSVNQ